MLRDKAAFHLHWALAETSLKPHAANTPNHEEKCGRPSIPSTRSRRHFRYKLKRRAHKKTRDVIVSRAGSEAARNG